MLMLNVLEVVLVPLVLVLVWSSSTKKVVLTCIATL